MKFGRADQPLNTIDFGIPESRYLLNSKGKAMNQSRLDSWQAKIKDKGKKSQFKNKKGKAKNKGKKSQIFFGAPLWGQKSWVGKIYPPKTSQKNFLAEYAQQFNSIEMNAMYYRLPVLSTVEKWRSQVSDSFLFCPKVPQGISHYGGLTNVTKHEELRLVLDAFGNNLGITFLQLHESFAPKNIDKLKQFLDKFKSYELAVELRHPDWYTQETGIFNWLAERNIAAVITDASGRRDVLHMQVTAKHQMVRWLGNNLHESDFERLDKWVNVLQDWFANGVERVYFFVHEPNDTYCPEAADYFVAKVNELLGLDLPKLTFYDQPSLL